MRLSQVPKLVVTLAAVLILSGVSLKGDEGPSRYQTKPESPTRPLTKEQQAAARAKGRLRKKIAPVFRRADLMKTSRSERPHVNDYFVVAKFHMPLATRAAELRFEVTEGVEQSTDQVADYLLSTPQKTVRDFRIVSRFKSEQDAETGLQQTRKRYDDYLEYQAKLLAYLKAERAKSLRRC